MSGKINYGLDYSPLFMFLLRKTGEKSDQVYSEAILRLDLPDPTFFLVALHETFIVSSEFLLGIKKIEGHLRHNGTTQKSQ